MILFLLAANDSNSNKEKEKMELIESLFRLHVNELINFAQARDCGYTVAEDIVQDAFKLLIEKYDEEKSKNARGWLYKTIDYLILNYKKAEKKHNSALSSIPQYEDNSIESYIVTKDILDIIRKKLTKNEYEIFLACFFVGDDNTETKKYNSSSENMRVARSKVKRRVIEILKKTEYTPSIKIPIQRESASESDDLAENSSLEFKGNENSASASKQCEMSQEFADKSSCNEELTELSDKSPYSEE